MKLKANKALMTIRGLAAICGSQRKVLFKTALEWNSPEQEWRALAENLLAAPASAWVALSINTRLTGDQARTINDALRAYGFHLSVPGPEADPGGLLFMGARGLAPGFALELEEKGMLTFPARPPTAPMLIGHWRFDDSVARIPAKRVVDDAAGRGNAGQLIGGRSWIIDGSERGQEFFGDGYVSVPFDPEFEIPGDMSLAIWVMAATVPEGNAMFIAGRGDPGRPYVMWWERTHVTFIQSGVHNQMLWLGHPHPPLNQWFHVAAVVSAQRGTFYINGQDVYSAGRMGIPAKSDCEFSIGGFRNQHHPCFKGRLKDVRLYNYALTPEAVAELAQNVPPDAREEARRGKRRR